MCRACNKEFFSYSSSHYSSMIESISTEKKTQWLIQCKHRVNSNKLLVNKKEFKIENLKVAKG